jgi:hypothetical protein
MGASQFRNRLEEWFEDVSDRVGCIGGALLWPLFEVVIYLSILLFPIWFLVMLFIGPGRPPPPSRSAPDGQRNNAARR